MYRKYKCRGRQEKVRPGTGREAGLGPCRERPGANMYIDSQDNTTARTVSV